MEIKFKYTTEWGNEPYEGPGKFEGERNAVHYAYELEPDDSFGDTIDFGFYAKYTLPDGEVIFTREDSQGFVSEIDEDDYTVSYGEFLELPGEDDIFTEDRKTFYQYQKLVFEVAEGEDVNAAIRKHCEKTLVWPTAFWVSDHGNYHVIKYWEKDA